MKHSAPQPPVDILDYPIWGVVKEWINFPRKPPKYACKVRTNLFAYHHTDVLARDLTYAEAAALLKVIGETK